MRHIVRVRPSVRTPSRENLAGTNSLQPNELALVAWMDSVVRDFHEIMCPIIIRKKLSGETLTYRLGRGRLSLRFYKPQAMASAARKYADVEALPINAGVLLARTDSGVPWGWNVVAFKAKGKQCKWNLTTSAAVSMEAAVSHPFALSYPLLLSSLLRERNTSRRFSSFQSNEIQVKDFVKILHLAAGIDTA